MKTTRQSKRKRPTRKWFISPVLVAYIAIVIVLLVIIVRGVIHNENPKLNTVLPLVSGTPTQTPTPQQQVQEESRTATWGLYKITSQEMVPVVEKRYKQNDLVNAVGLARNQLYLTTGREIQKIDVSTQQQQTLFSVQSPYIALAQYNRDLSKLFVVKYNPAQDFGEMTVMDPNGSVLEQASRIPMHKSYGTFEVLGAHNGAYIIKKYFGDGCGSGGSVYLKKNDQINNLVDIGTGCDSNSRFYGYSLKTNSLILASVRKPDDTNDYEYVLNELYLQNVGSGELTRLLDLHGRKDDLLAVADLKGEKIAILAAGSMTLLDLNEKKILSGKQSRFENTRGYRAKQWFGENIYLFSEIDRRNVEVLNPVTGEFHKVPFPNYVQTGSIFECRFFQDADTGAIYVWIWWL